MSTSSTSKALKDLSQTKFDASRVDEFVNEINSGNDRAVAIVWGAMTEDALHRAIIRWMNHLSKDEHERLTGPNGPLATFSGKITIGYAIRLLEREHQRDLHIVREVRNAFAHSIVGLSFTTKETVGVCERFSLATKLKAKGRLNARACYAATCLRAWSGLGCYGVSMGFKIETGEVFPVKWVIGEEERNAESDEETP